MFQVRDLFRAFRRDLARGDGIVEIDQYLAEIENNGWIHVSHFELANISEASESKSELILAMLSGSLVLGFVFSSLTKPLSSFHIKYTASCSGPFNIM